MNRSSLLQYIFISIVVVLASVYALPNIYGTLPAVQVSAAGASVEISELTQLEVDNALDAADIKSMSTELTQSKLTLIFVDQATQLLAKDALQNALSTDYIVALNLAPATPEWLKHLGAAPMFLGLDLRGGVHFLMDVDMQAAIKHAEERYISDIRTTLREKKVRYKTVTRGAESGVSISYRDEEQKQIGDELIKDEFRDLDIFDKTSAPTETRFLLKDEIIQETRRQSLQQNITTLKKRVNELGVAEPVIQQQGEERIVVQLPGVQDTARAKDILGATATLEFRLVDEEHSLVDAIESRAPPGSRLYRHRSGGQILLKKRVILTGDSIIAAASGIDPQFGSPAVFITLDGKGAKQMSNITADNVGKRMAVVFIENKTQMINVDGEMIREQSTTSEVINAAEINERLGKKFQITGLDSTQEAYNLALLLRAGALAAPMQIVEERTVGASLGQDNIDQGFNSVIIGFLLVLIFIGVYYGMFGIFADIALVLNLVLIVALLSLLQATLTLPGIAGIVLTVGMAVDANVLIFERIREELRNANSPQSSIRAGYAKAFATIADANVTTLIAALVLFSFGTGPIKGFAVTLSLGIICSMFTAVMVTRVLVNLFYGGRKLDNLRI